MPDPATTPATNPNSTKQKFPVEAPPQDWASKTDSQKFEWLDTHGSESDPTINLGDCYRRGSKLTHIFSTVFKVIKRISEAVKTKGTPTLRKYLNAFITALNNGVGHLSNYIYTNVTALLKTGAFNDGASELAPVAIPDLPTVGDDPAVTLPAGGKPFDTSFWGIFLDTLNVLVNSWPWLNKVKGKVQLSYAQLLKIAITAGQDFFTEYQKANSGDKPQSDEDIFVIMAVSSAVSDGLVRNLPWKSSDDEPSGDGDAEFVELQELMELAPAWDRVR